jgi:hypothetical protein
MSDERDEASSAEPAQPKAAEAKAVEPRPAEPAGEARPSELPPWTRWVAPLAALGAAIAGGQLYGPPGVVLVLAGSALVAVIALFWQSLRTLLGETPLSGADAYALGAPRTEEEQKRNVLRALKDLEFERAVGKISDDDYKQLVTHYRKEAKRLLRTIDEQNAPQRARAAQLADERLAKLGLLAKPEGAPKADDASEPKSEEATEPKSEEATEPKSEEADRG